MERLKNTMQNFGKKTVSEKFIRDYTMRNPEAVIVRVSASGIRVEKPVKGVVVQDLLPRPKGD